MFGIPQYYDRFSCQLARFFRHGEAECLYGAKSAHINRPTPSVVGDEDIGQHHIAEQSCWTFSLVRRMFPYAAGYWRKRYWVTVRRIHRMSDSWRMEVWVAYVGGTVRRMAPGARMRRIYRTSDSPYVGFRTLRLTAFGSGPWSNASCSSVASATS